jgi:hypothetical protein
MFLLFKHKQRQPVYAPLIWWIASSCATAPTGGLWPNGLGKVGRACGGGMVSQGGEEGEANGSGPPSQPSSPSSGLKANTKNGLYNCDRKRQDAPPWLLEGSGTALKGTPG